MCKRHAYIYIYTERGASKRSCKDLWSWHKLLRWRNIRFFVTRSICDDIFNSGISWDYWDLSTMSFHFLRGRYTWHMVSKMWFEKKALTFDRDWITKEIRSVNPSVFEDSRNFSHITSTWDNETYTTDIPRETPLNLTKWSVCRTRSRWIVIAGTSSTVIVCIRSCKKMKKRRRWYVYLIHSDRDHHWEYNSCLSSLRFSSSGAIILSSFLAVTLCHVRGHFLVTTSYRFLFVYDVS